MTFKNNPRIGNTFKQKIEAFIWSPLIKQDRILFGFAWFFSIIYGLLTSFRNQLFKNEWLKTQTLDEPVLSVGNLTIGGSGKSPFTLWVSQKIKSEGKNVVILSRGYGAKLHSKQYGLFQNGKLVRSHNVIDIHCDEPAMISKIGQVHVVVGPDRFNAAKWYLSFSPSPPDVWILDDGFQHQRLARQLNILLVDETNPFGNQQLLPLGPLREPLGAAQRANLVVRTRSRSLNFGFLTNLPQFPVFHNITLTKSLQSEAWENKFLPTCLVSGIARPNRLLEDLKDKLSITPKTTVFVADHSKFCMGKVRRIANDCKSVLTTQKDYFRQPDFFHQVGFPVFIIDLELSMESEKEKALLAAIQTKLLK